MVSGHMYVIETDAIDVYADADDTSPVLAILAPGEKVDVTGKKQTRLDPDHAQGRCPLGQVLRSDRRAGRSAPSRAPGGESESGLQPDTVRVLRAVCAKFPAVRSYGGRRGGGGDHATGRALDIMVGPATGDRIAAFLQKHRAELGIDYLIWQQRIWRPSTSDSWRGMSDRGSPTANHMDHVHVSTYGNSGSA